jgi:hypothetical protein
MIEPLPEGHPHTCDKDSAGGGWSRNNVDPHRCGKPAVVIDRQTCCCGQCDMSCHLCDYHARQSGTESERREDAVNHYDFMEAEIKKAPDGENKDRVLNRLAEMRKAEIPTSN